MRRQTWTATLTTTQQAVVAVVATPAERLASMWSLSMDAWALSGQPIPDYDRAHMPGRVIRRFESR